VSRRSIAAVVLFAAGLAAQQQEKAPVIFLLGATRSAECALTKDLTVFEVMARGGWQPAGDLSIVVLVRFADGVLRVTRVDIRKMITTGRIEENFVVHDGDLLFVQKRDEGKDKDVVDVALLAVVAARKLEASQRALIAGYRLLHGAKVEAQLRLAMQLGQLGKDAAAAVPDLVKALALDARVAREAVTALGMIGPAAKEAVPALRDLAQSKDEQLRVRAAAALRQIEVVEKGNG
jgi:hypothetical protein